MASICNSRSGRVYDGDRPGGRSIPHGVAGRTGRVLGRLRESPIPNELAVDGRQDAYIGGQTYMAVMNSELTDTYTGVGWRGSGRSMSPTMGFPSYHLSRGWVGRRRSGRRPSGSRPISPTSAAGMPISRAEGAFIGATNVYRVSASPARAGSAQGFWSDQGGSGSPGFGAGTVGPGGYREPFITETTFNTNAGIRVLASVVQLQLRLRPYE